MPTVGFEPTTQKKTLTTILKASRQKRSSCQLYSNEENGLQQFQMESCQPIRRLKDKKKKNPRKSEWPQTHTLDLAATGIGS
jgi:hypothetical protein